jgi:ArsR family transcriptional regulator
MAGSAGWLVSGMKPMDGPQVRLVGCRSRHAVRKKTAGDTLAKAEWTFKIPINRYIGSRPIRSITAPEILALFETGGSKRFGALILRSRRSAVTQACPTRPLTDAHVPVARDEYFNIIETMKSNDAIETLSALASDARLAVFRLLVKRGPQGYTPSELVERLGVRAPTLSFHLKGLVHADLVVSRRDGRNLYYSPNLERMNELVGFLTANCCSLADEACGASCQPLAVAPQRKRA